MRGDWEWEDICKEKRNKRAKPCQRAYTQTSGGINTKEPCRVFNKVTSVCQKQNPKPLNSDSSFWLQILRHKHNRYGESKLWLVIICYRTRRIQSTKQFSSCNAKHKTNWPSFFKYSSGLRFKSSDTVKT